MSRKKRPVPTSRPNSKYGSAAASSRSVLPTDTRARIGFLIVVLVLASVVVIGADFVFGAIANGGTTTGETVVQGQGGQWTNVTPDRLAQMMEHKDFTLLNVKTPYYSEIEGTDLWIPYDQLAARASELPADKGAKILVYCLTGHSSAVAAQTLLSLGYTNVWNLAGGMDAWTASGRTLVDKHR